MNTVSNSGSRRLPDFFVTEKECTSDSIGVAVVPEERWDEFLAFCAGRAKEGKAEEMRAAKEPGASDANLTPEQIRYLRGKYDPHHMNQTEYADFIQDLIDFGVLTDDHTPYLECYGVGKGYTEGWHSVGSSGTYCAGLNMFEPMSLADSSGDAMRWAKFQSLFLKYDEETQTYYLGRKALAFSKVYSAMQQMDQQSPASKEINYQQSQQTHQASRLMFDLRNSRITAPVTAVRR